MGCRLEGVDLLSLSIYSGPGREYQEFRAMVQGSGFRVQGSGFRVQDRKFDGLVSWTGLGYRV